MSYSLRLRLQDFWVRKQFELPISFFADSEGVKIKKKFHDKRQTAPPYYFQPQQSILQSQYPLTRPYFPAPRYQYNAGFKNSGRAKHPIKPPPSTFAAQPYSQTIKAQPQGQYISYYYPHRTHYRDWSQKLLEASAYAQKWQLARKQEMAVRNQNANQGDAGIKLFVAGINPNGDVQGKWVDQSNLQASNGQKNQELLRNKPLQQNVVATNTNVDSSGSTRPIEQSASAATVANANSGRPNNNPILPKLNPQLGTNPPSNNANQFSPTQAKANPISSSRTVAVGVKNPNFQTKTQTNSLLDKVSTTKPTLNGAILSENLGGAVLGPNAHSLLQSATSQQTPGSGTHGEPRGGVGAPVKPNINLSPKPNSIQNTAPPKPGENINTKFQNNNVPRQGQGKNLPLQINKGTGNVQSDANSLPRKNTAFPPPSANLSPKRLSVTSGSKISFVKPQMKTTQPPKGLALNAANIDKSTAQELNAWLSSKPVPRPPSQAAFPQPPATNATPNNKNLALSNSASGNTNPNQTPLHRELALKNLLFPPPPAFTRKQDSQSTSLASSNAIQKNVSPPQIVPSFPAFRYDANLPVTGQTGFSSFRRNYIPDAASVAYNKKSLVPQHGPVPYKSSFPLMLHKISPYFKMKRNLKRMAGGQAKARRRFLELQSRFQP